MNWNPARHEPLHGPAWSPDRAREALSGLLDDLEAAWREGEGWPPHPRDDGARASGQYFGTAGVVTGLRRMYDWTGRTPRVPLAEVVRSLQSDGSPDEEHPSLLIGRTGRALAVYREVPSTENAFRVLRCIQANDGSTEHELMWGLAGTLEAAVWMFHATGDARFAEAGRRQVHLLWQAWERPEEGPPTWLQTLDGERRRYLGAAHGQVGNLHALWSAVAAWPDAADRDELLARTVELLRSTAVHGPHGTNWAPTLGGQAGLLQWCHGAPGVVSALHRAPVGLSDELEDLLRRGAELVWHAGPLRKGHGLCHGTSGNGFALLALWERTSEPVWLERARAFAMHALRQRERIEEEFGRGWYSLWTGDVGLGVFLCACLEPSAVWDGWERF